MSIGETSISVSVIIPYYNGKKYIAEAIRSVLNQTRLPEEIIVINDGSATADTEKLAEFDDNIITVVHQENAGVSVARNTGILLAKCDYISFIDQDDYWEPTKLARQVEYINENPECKALHTAVKRVSESGEQNEYRKKQLNLEDFLCNFPGPAYLSSTIIEKQTLLKAGLFNPFLVYSQDNECFLRCSLLFPFHYIDETLTIRRNHGDNLSNDSPGVWKEGIRIIRMYETSFDDSAVFRDRVYFMHLEFAYLAIKEKNWIFLRKIITELPREKFSKIVFIIRIMERKLMKLW